MHLRGWERGASIRGRLPYYSGWRGAYMWEAYERQLKVGQSLHTYRIT